MTTGYTRQSSATIVAGLTITAASFNNEFNQLQAAFDIASGHIHDGTTAGGAPKLALTTSVTGILPVANGGSGAATFTANGVLLGNTASAFTVTAAGTANQVLRIPGAGGAPAFGSIDLTQAAAVGATILGAANGGTGNAFFAVSGPATSTKTYALPNASCSILTTNALVSPAQGGTGVASVPTNGQLLIGNGTTYTVATITPGTNIAVTNGAGTLTLGITGIIAGANGGTNNAFFQVSGPTTSTKTYTFPDATCTVLTTNAAVSVAQGGTGQTTLAVGSVLTGNGTGGILGTAPGTTGNVLVSNAGAWTSTAPSAAYGTVLIATATAAGSATVSFTSGIDTTYDEYEIRFNNVVAATNAVQLQLRISQATVFKSGATNYAHCRNVVSDAATAAQNGATAGAGGSAAISLTTATISNVAGRGAQGAIRFARPGVAAEFKHFRWDIAHFDGTNSYSTTGQGFYTVDGGAIDGVQFLASSGNLTSGNFALYGIRKV